MPNFWSKSGQFFSEKFFGSRTKDEDFNKLCETMKSTEKGLASLRIILQNFKTYTENFKKYFTDFNDALKLLYANSPFVDFIEEITVKHLIISSELDEVNKKMNILCSKTSEWSIIFNSAKDQIKTREEKRRVYDHYEGKISKLNKNNGKKDQKYIERNESKFSKAASEYVEISEKTFNTIVNSLRVAYELTNPVIDSILSEEYKLFKNLDKSMECFGNNNERFKEIKNHYDNPNINKENITYDPTKYMAEKGLMKKLSMRKMTTTRLLPTKKAGSLNSTDIKFTNRRMSVFSKPNDKNVEYLGIENYENIYVNSRMTNSFGEIKNEKLTEFYEFEDDFD